MEIEFLYDFGSPNAYLVEAVLPGIAARRGATIRRMPVLLGGLFRIIGNRPPIDAFSGIPGKVEYLRAEMRRFVERHGVPFLWNPHFPILTTPLMRAAIHAAGKDWEDRFRDLAYRHCWVEGTDMTDPEAIRAALGEGGLPADEILAATRDPGIKAALFAATQTAADRGAFGVPTMFLGDEMFFGKDSLADLESALERGS